MSTSPASAEARAPKRVMSRSENSTDRVPMQIVTGRKASPICSAS